MNNEINNITTNDFNDLLNVLICDENESKETNRCLISDEALEIDYIKLVCNHSFNYLPIFKEVLKQKKFNHLEVQHLGKYQIKCPYCRNVQTGILPWRHNVKRILNVNWPPDKTFKQNKCKYVFKSGKRKDMQCCKPCHYSYCSGHEKKIKKKNTLPIVSEQTPKICKKYALFKCQHVLARGKNKGCLCNKNVKRFFDENGTYAKSSHYFCTVHKKIYPQLSNVGVGHV